MRFSLLHRLGCLFLTLLLAEVASAVGPPVRSVVHFDRDIAPLLARRCLDCHGAVAPEGGLNLSRRAIALKAIVPGNLHKSRLWRRVNEDEMPPSKALSAEEKALLRTWISSGAAWGSDPLDPYRFSGPTRAGYDWWSLEPVRRPAVPAVRDRRWANNPIDRFLLARLDQRRLTPSPRTDRRTLIRRLSFDLLGLPPTPDQVDAFVADTRANAYERLVDQLLASPRHGERWGRHWLDVVRYGESDGFERDMPRMNAWPYRDWVVGAFNSDMPYDEFARLQLAGDVLRPADPDAMVATGFLVAGPHDIVVPASEAMRASQRQDELEDIIGTVGQTFLGMTVHCARCHDHKFDPLPQRDYYRLAAALGGVRHGSRQYIIPQVAASLQRLRDRLAQLEGERTALEAPIRKQLLARQRSGDTTDLRALFEWDFTRDSERPAVKLHGKATFRPDGLHLDGGSSYASTGPIGKDLQAKTLEAWVRPDTLDQRGGGVVSVQALDGTLFDAIVFGEQQPRRWMAGSEGFVRTRSFDAPAEAEATRRFVHVAITYAADGTITGYRDGKPYGKAYRTRLNTFAAKQSQVIFGMRHGTAPGGNRMLSGVIARARLYDRALSADEVARSSGQPVVLVSEVVAQLDAKGKRRHKQLSSAIEQARHDLSRRDGQSQRNVFAVTPSKPDKTRVLLRGNAGTPAEVVSAEVFTALADRLPATKVRPDDSDDRRRTALASWMTDARNPLFARVMVNRLWQYHFGVGIVDTPSDLGFNGGRPSHPELLDYLADEFIRSGWSLKHVHRLIVTSSAYRQASAPRADARRIDADNRLLWRKSPRRLEAEALRDSVLAITGELDATIGGAPYLDFRSYFFKGTQFYDPIEQVGSGFTRRSLYRMWARGGRNSLLDALDCPDPSATTPRRAVTSTPLQALTLFNNAFVLDQADKLARRLRRLSPQAATQTREVYRLAFGRQPTAAELQLVVPFVQSHGVEALARVLFNTAEFMQID